jgi:hypothetical protein
VLVLCQERVAREEGRGQGRSEGAPRDSNVIETFFVAPSGTPRRSKGGRRAVGPGRAAEVETRCVRSDRRRTIAILPVGACVFLGVVRREVRAKSGEASSSHLQGVIGFFIENIK